MTGQNKKRNKKPYAAPALTRYGNLRQLTKGKGGNKGDGAGKPSTRIGGAPG